MAAAHDLPTEIIPAIGRAPATAARAVSVPVAGQRRSPARTAT